MPRVPFFLAVALAVVLSVGLSALTTWGVSSAVLAGATATKSTGDPVAAKSTNGTDGAQGSAGADGAQGAAGSTGASGAPGVAGSRGSQGSAGANGSNGVNGSDGANGADGATGAAGANGPAGATGAQGPAGSDATSGIVREDYAGAPFTLVVGDPESFGNQTPTITAPGPALLGFSIQFTVLAGDTLRCQLENAFDGAVLVPNGYQTSTGAPMTFSGSSVGTIAAGMVLLVRCDAQTGSITGSYADQSLFYLPI